MARLFNFIDGIAQQRAGKFAENGKNEFADSDFMDVVASVKAANTVQRKWRESVDANSILKKLGDLVELSLESFAQLESENGAMPLATAQKIVARALASYRNCVAFEPKLENQADQFQVAGAVGTVGLITSWQDSFANILENLAVALKCRNQVILFPSEYGMLSALKLAELTKDAGVPAGVVNILLGRGEELAVHIAEHPGIKYLKFYGTNELGEKLARIASENLKRFSSELGANNVGVVFADADLQKIMPRAQSLAFDFHLHGKNRISRVLVQEKILKDFKNAFDSALAQTDKNFGSFADANLNKEFASYIEQSKLDRAKIYKSIETFPPITVYDDLSNCSTLHQRSLVGPILFIQSFKYAADLGKVLNSGTFGKIAYVWTNDLIRMHKLTEQLEISQIYFNPVEIKTSLMSANHLKQSGSGESGIQALYDFYSTKKRVEINPS